MAYMRFAELYPLYFASLFRFEVQRKDVLETAKPYPVSAAGAAGHEVTVAARLTGMRDGSIRRVCRPMLVALILWSFMHGTIQVAQTKRPFLEKAGFTSNELLLHSIKLGMCGLVPDPADLRAGT